MPGSAERGARLSSRCSPPGPARPPCHTVQGGWAPAGQQAAPLRAVAAAGRRRQPPLRHLNAAPFSPTLPQDDRLTHRQPGAPGPGGICPHHRAAAGRCDRHHWWGVSGPASLLPLGSVDAASTQHTATIPHLFDPLRAEPGTSFLVYGFAFAFGGAAQALAGVRSPAGCWTMRLERRQQWCWGKHRPVRLPRLIGCRHLCLQSRQPAAGGGICVVSVGCWLGAIS